MSLSEAPCGQSKCPSNGVSPPGVAGAQPTRGALGVSPQLLSYQERSSAIAMRSALAAPIVPSLKCPACCSQVSADHRAPTGRSPYVAAPRRHAGSPRARVTERPGRGSGGAAHARGALGGVPPEISLISRAEQRDSDAQRRPDLHAKITPQSPTTNNQRQNAANEPPSPERQSPPPRQTPLPTPGTSPAAPTPKSP